MIAMVLCTAVTIGTGTATAAPTAGSGPAGQETPTLVEVKPGGAVIQADCASGDFCVWSTAGQPCSWDLDDPDWWAGVYTCSWAPNAKVKWALDNGNDSRFVAVQLFMDADYFNTVGCLRQGVTYEFTNGGGFLRSHRWVTGYC